MKKVLGMLMVFMVLVNGLDARNIEVIRHLKENPVTKSVQKRFKSSLVSTKVKNILHNPKKYKANKKQAQAISQIGKLIIGTKGKVGLRLLQGTLKKVKR